MDQLALSGQNAKHPADAVKYAAISTLHVDGF